VGALVVILVLALAVVVGVCCRGFESFLRGSGRGVSGGCAYAPWWAGLDATGVCLIVAVEVGVVRNGRADLVEIPGVTDWVLRNETRIHWVGVISGDVVTLTFELGDVEDGHHHAVFVNEVVAVEHVQTVPWSVDGANLGRLAWLNVDDILESGALVWEKTSGTASALDDLERNKVDVNRVDTWTTGVVDLPHLGRTLFWTGKDTVVDIIVVDTVDGPVVVASNLKVEDLRDLADSLWPLNGRIEGAWDITVVSPVADRVSDNELHHLIGVVVDFDLAVWSGTHVVAHGEVLSSIWSKVKDDFVTLTRSHLKVLCGDRRAEKTTVGSDSWELDPVSFWVGNVNVPWTTEGEIEETKAVLAWLDIHEWPWLTVDFVHITELVEVLADREGEVTAVVVCSILECKWDIVVVLRKSKVVLVRVVNDPDTSKTVVGVRCSLMIGVVVVPDRSSYVVVWVVVILELVGQDHVIRPSIPRGVSCKC